MGSVFCPQHFRLADCEMSDADAARLAREILPPGEGLASAQAVNAALTRVFRAVAEQRISPRYATVLAYLGQLITITVARMEREAAAAEPPAYPLGDAPEAIVAELAEALRSSLQDSGSPATASKPLLPEPGVIEEVEG